MKIYISNPGIICAAGRNIDELWQNLLKADSSFIKKTVLSNGNQVYAAQISDEVINQLEDAKGLLKSRMLKIENSALNQISGTINLAIHKFGKSRIAVCVGSCDNLTENSNPAHYDFFTKGDFGTHTLENQSAHYVSTYIKELYDLDNICCTYSTACSSSAIGIIKGAQLIKAGLADAVIAGGVDIASQTALYGFSSLEAISPEPTNPFSKNRRGITLGEAAAFFVLSKEDLDNTGITLAGYGESADAYHMTSPDPSGDGAKRAIQDALKMAAIAPNQIDYLNLHGTGTKYNDSMEAKAVDAVFGQYKVPCSSTKATTGHTLGAAASLELAICFKTLQENNQLPPQVWDNQYDDELPQINITDNSIIIKKETQLKYCMSNSFAFGGSNASLIIEKN